MAKRASLTHLYLSELARPAGSFSAPLRAALEQARRHRGNFTANEFREWLEQAGGENNKMAAYLRRLVAEPGIKPDAAHPLVLITAGRAGRGGNHSVFRYAYNGSAGTDLRGGTAASYTRKAKEPEAPTEPDADEPEYSEDDGWQTVPNEDDADTEEPEQGDEEDQGDDSGETDDDDGVDAEEEPEEDSGTDEDTQWLPKADAMGSYPEVSMEKLQAAGYGAKNPIWVEIAGSDGDVSAHKIIRAKLPLQLQRAAIQVAIQVFKNLNQDWDGSGTTSESTSPLMRLYVRESNSDPVDFDQVSGLERIKRGR